MVYSPGFFGLFNSQRGMLAAQTALNTVNHNISNANTPGYTRQRVELVTNSPYQSPSLQSGTLLQMGQGVIAEEITQIRNAFLDERLQEKHSVAERYQFQTGIMTQLEGIVGEPSDSGLSATIQLLFESVEDLTLNPESLAARAAFMQQVADSVVVMQQQGEQLLSLHENLVGVEAQPQTFEGSQVGISVSEFNGDLQSLVDLNKQISQVTTIGGQPNDLLDARRNVLESLAKVADVTVTEGANSIISVSLGGQQLVRGLQLLDTLEVVANTGANATQVPVAIQTATGGTNITANIQGGRLRGILDAAGDDTSLTNVYARFDELNTLAETLADTMNAVQQAGRDLAGTQHAAGAFSELIEDGPSYTGTGPRLMAMQVNNNLVTTPQNIALAADDATFAGNFGGPGDNRNALAMAALRGTTHAALNDQTYEDYYQGQTARLGIDARAVRDRSTTEQQLVSSLQEQISSISGVNIDEETIDLIRFQRAFEASSRMIRTFNEIYQTIINMV